MNTNMEVTPLVGIHTSATNVPVVLTINDVQEAGFQARMVHTPMILDCTQMELNAREKINRENNVNVVYVCFTEEMLNSIKEQGDTIPGLSGDLNMPKFDKLIMATSAGQAVLTTMYHLSEGHNVTNCIDKLYLLEQVVDNDARHLRHGFQMINIFNRRFTTPLLQVPTGSSITFNGWERSRQIVWELRPLDDGNIFNAVYNRFTWTNGCMWSYNTLIHVSNLEAYLPNNEVAIIQAFEDAGAQVLQHLPQQALGKVLEFLNSLDTLRFSTRRNLRLNRVSFWGVKDGSKMRGSSTHAQYLVSYMQESASFNTYAEEVNAWRTAFNNGEMDYAMEEDQGGD